MENMIRLERQAKRAVTIADREQARGTVDGGIKQTVRMYRTITAAQRATSALARERLSLRLLQGGRA
jgi:hypothetical protein